MSGFVLDDTAKVSADRRGVAILAVDLVVVEGPSRGARVRVESGVAKVGSGEECALRLDDRAVSRLHLELVIRASTIGLRDLGSTNGTFIGDVRVRDADLTPGTVVRLGSSAFRVDASDEPAFVAISSHTSFGELIGGSLAMRQAYTVLERVAASDSTLLVQGETGTGKDVAARSVHAASKRKSGPFVPIDCGAIPEQLFESELFGHVRGAFTGALQNRAGAFEEAIGGTLFLDEIGEMPLPMQAKLLRAIETRRVRRVGSSKETDVDVRIICATNRRLATMVNEGMFREDLYYRLAVVEVMLPPLRERREDIPTIAEALHARLSCGAAMRPELLHSLQGRSFPGNVRELRNAVERAITLGETAPGGAMRTATATALPQGIEAIVPLHLPLKDARDVWTNEFENIYIRAMMRQTNGNLTRAAELAGVSRRFMQRTIARLGLKSSGLDDADD